MYNGIGLQTARGSGTNGYVQRNLAFVRNRTEKVEYKTEEDLNKTSLRDREPNAEILEHERKRKVEVQCMELREMLENEGFDQETIDSKVNGYRKKLIEKMESTGSQIARDESGRPIASGTHQNAAANLSRNKKLRDAFGISEDYVDGSSMNPLLRAQREAAEKEKKKKAYKMIKDPDDDYGNIPNKSETKQGRTSEKFGKNVEAQERKRSERRDDESRSRGKEEIMEKDSRSERKKTRTQRDYEIKEESPEPIKSRGRDRSRSKDRKQREPEIKRRRHSSSSSSPSPDRKLSSQSHQFRPKNDNLRTRPPPKRDESSEDEGEASSSSSGNPSPFKSSRKPLKEFISSRDKKKQDRQSSSTDSRESSDSPPHNVRKASRKDDRDSRERRRSPDRRRERSREDYRRRRSRS